MPDDNAFLDKASASFESTTSPDAPPKPSDPPPEALPGAGEAPPRYRLVEEIAGGGMGAVFRAVDGVLNREVAVKVLHERFPPGSGGARRFADEARITAQLQHPAIPP